MCIKVCDPIKRSKFTKDQVPRSYAKNVASNYSTREAIARQLPISPWIIGFLVCTGGAMAFSRVVSFGHYEPTSNSMRSIETAHEGRLVEGPRAGLSPANTLSYAVMAISLEKILALLFAFLLNKTDHGSGISITVFHLPKKASCLATSFICNVQLNSYFGAINRFASFQLIQLGFSLRDAADHTDHLGQRYFVQKNRYEGARTIDSDHFFVTVHPQGERNE